MTESDYGRRPLTIVELVQPRCALRFGVSPCAASGTPKCYNTWGTCKDRANIDLSGSITWRYRRPDGQILPLYEEDGEHIKTNPLPMLMGVSTSSSSISLGAQRDGQSPLGVRASVRIDLRDMPWDDYVGDYYLADRSSVQGSFWKKWRARTPFYAGMAIRVYEGYWGQALGDMQRRDYVLSKFSLNSQGAVALEGDDPLQLANEKDAQFPRATDVRLVGDIDEATTTIRVDALAVEDLTGSFGNTTTKYIRIGQEIIGYTGKSDVAGSLYDLTGVRRGRLGTAAATATAGAVCQRVGRYENIAMWQIAADLIDSHTRIPAEYRDSDQWAEEGLDYLTTQRSDATVTAPESVEKLLGELCQQGGFAIWWDERQRTIPLQANRPPKGTPIAITDDLNILAGTATLRDDPKAQISRVAIYYAPVNPFDLAKPENYRVLRLNIDSDIEAEGASGKETTLTIYSRWITRDTDALSIAAKLLLRYKYIPQYLSLELDAKDRSTQIGDVLRVTTHAIEDSEGNPLSMLWQVLSAEEHRPGDALRLELQSFNYGGARFGVIMPDTATDDYSSATDDEKETGCYIAETVSELTPGGDPPYLVQ